MEGELWGKSQLRIPHNRINDGGTLNLVTMITSDGKASIEWVKNTTTKTQSEP
jgi:hypothetical protein